MQLQLSALPQLNTRIQSPIVSYVSRSLHTSYRKKETIRVSPLSTDLYKNQNINYAEGLLAHRNAIQNSFGNRLPGSTRREFMSATMCSSLKYPPEDEFHQQYAIGNTRPSPRYFLRNYLATATPAIGIDLGTTNSCIASVVPGTHENTAKVIENEDGQRTTPSVVAYGDETSSPLVGVSAKRQIISNPKNTFFNTKRLIGRSLDDEEVKEFAKALPYELVAGPNNSLRLKTSLGRIISPSEVAAAILSRLQQVASRTLGVPVKKAVITVPAYFNDEQRSATKVAGDIAGLDVIRIINEPTAAALAYGMQSREKNSTKEKTIAVYDLGGGTFDVSVLTVNNGLFEVKATNGDTSLGGQDYDNVLQRYIYDEFKKTEGIDLSNDALAKQRIRDAAETAKIELSTRMETEVNLPFISADASGPKHLRVAITRAKFEQISEDITQRTKEPVLKCLRDAEIDSPTQVDSVLLVGGMTRTPRIRGLVNELFQQEPSHAVNPDEAVATGAAVQAAIIQGSVKDLILLDVAPLSLGIEVMGGAMSKLISRNSSIPTRKTEYFSTAADNQTSVKIKVFQGERAMAEDNKLLGTFDLIDIPAAPRGAPQIAVTFDIDANGIIQISAKEMSSGKENNLSIESSNSAFGGMSKEEVEEALKESEKYKKMDQEKVELIDLRNQLENVIHSASNSKLPADSLVGTAIDEARNILTSTDVKKMRGVLANLQKAIAEAKNKTPSDSSK